MQWKHVPRMNAPARFANARLGRKVVLMNGPVPAGINLVGMHQTVVWYRRAIHSIPVRLFLLSSLPGGA